MKTVFLRALEADDKAAALRSAIRQPEAAQGKQRFELDAASLASVPGSAFAYWIQPSTLALFRSAPRIRQFARAWVGLQTNEDFRWVRTWWEVAPCPIGNASPVPFAKGGAFSSFYADVDLTLRWGLDGYWIKSWKNDQLRQGKITANNSKCWNEGHYFRPGITWPSRTQTFGPRVLPASCIFAHKGPAAFVDKNDTSAVLTLLSIMNARPFSMLIETRLNAADATARSYEVGLIEETPFASMDDSDELLLAGYSRRSWSLKRKLDTRTESSHAFMLPALSQVAGDTLSARAAAWAEHVRAVEAELAAIQTEIDERCFDLYGIDEAERRSISEGSGGRTDASMDTADTDADAEGDADDEREVESGADETVLAAELVSWAVGVALGRFDVRLGTGARALPAEPEPFDPLPVCSPAMLTGADGFPLARAPAGYPIAFPESGILVDDPGHPRDLTAAVRVVFDEVFGVSADSWWQEVAALLNPKDHDLRAWLASGFFEHHLKRHSKSRRKAPILWQFGTPSGRYSVWLYAHRLTRDSFFQLQNDVVAPKLAHEERQLTSLVQTTGGNPSAKERKEIAAQEDFVEELRALLDQVRRVAPLWNPTLDDGVVLTMAPLWRLVPQHKPWQKELKGKWEELAAGKYDWAHLAMHLWPERVIPKCATDRSLAIAHGLENVFWVEGDDGKWKPRPAPTHPVEELVRERASSAAKAAMKSLLETPAAIAGGSRRRGRARARRASTTAVAERID